MSVRRRPIIATVWRPEEFSPGVAWMARNTGTVALVDISPMTLSDAAPILRRAEAGGEAVHLKARSQVLGDPALPELLKSLAIRGLWVELHSLLLDDDPHLALERLLALTPAVEVFPILSETPFILEVLEQYPGLSHLVLKGCEAGGLVGSESSFSL